MEDELDESATLKPLFEEPSSEHERPDPWTGPKGFMLGGMALPTKFELSQQYFDAANLLIEAVKRDEMEDYKLTNPILFLYRHSLELALKSFISTAGEHHRLGSLADEFERAFREKFSDAPPSWIKATLNEIASIDPNSTAFRYAENRDTTRRKWVPVDGEVYVGLRNLQETMKTLNAILVALNGGRGPHA